MIKKGVTAIIRKRKDIMKWSVKKRKNRKGPTEKKTPEIKKIYLVTGAAGHLGSVLISELLSRNETVRAFDLPSLGKYVPPEAEFFAGDITDSKSLDAFFDCKNYDYVTLIHCAALVTVASKINPKVWLINVKGTENVMSQALRAGVNRVVYISTVHAIPERPSEETINEVKNFSPELVTGQYSRSKASAAQIVMGFAKKGLNVSIIHPSAIIGPGDKKGNNHMIRTINAMAKGTIPVAVQGGYDLVDVRDVVAGILSCEKNGLPGECYILSGHFITIPDLLNTVRKIRGKRARRIVAPNIIAKIASPAMEKLAILLNRPPSLLTPTSVYIMNSNGRFSHEKASIEFDYSPRSIEESIRDSIYVK